jgi:hypothetical protein
MLYQWGTHCAQHNECALHVWQPAKVRELARAAPLLVKSATCTPRPDNAREDDTCGGTAAPYPTGRGELWAARAGNPRPPCPPADAADCSIGKPKCESKTSHTSHHHKPESPHQPRG